MNEIKRAIESAQKRLEDETSEKLKTEVYQFLKSELGQIDSLEDEIRKAQEQKRIHEENIKNVKAGNLEAIEKRRQAVNGTWTTFTYSSTIPAYYFYNEYVAGNAITLPSGKTIIF